MRRLVLSTFALLLSLVIAFPAFAANTTPTYSTALEVLNALIAAGAPINPDYLMDFTEATDPNEMMGKKAGAYTSKTDFGCTGYKQSDPSNYTGGTVEVFSSDELCMNRYNYLMSIYLSSPVFQDTIDYPRGNILVRIDLVIDKEKTDAILTAMDAIGLPPSQIKAEPTPEPTPTPVPTPTPAPTPQPAYFDLQKGDSGPTVVQLQTRLKELGFLSGNADGDFGGKTVKAVAAFQKANGLEQAGIASAADQSLLFSADALNAKGQKQAVAVFDESMCPVQVTNIKVKSSYGSPYVTFKLKNIGQIAIKALTYEIECSDAYGDRVTYYSDSSFSDTYGKTIAPGKSASINTNNARDSGIYGFDGTNTVRIAVIRVLLEDGTDIQYSGDEAVWYEGSK